MPLPTEANVFAWIPNLEHAQIQILDLDKLDPMDEFLIFFWTINLSLFYGLPALSHVWQHVKLSDALSWGPSAI